MRINDNGIDRDMTAQELAEYQTWAEQAQQQQLAADAAAQAAADARTSALAKLSALGLTQAEIAALLGA